MRNAARLVLTQRIRITAGFKKCQPQDLTGGEMRVCHTMNNRSLVVPPGAAGACSPSGGQGGDHVQTCCPPVFVLCTGSARRAFL